MMTLPGSQNSPGLVTSPGTTLELKPSSPNSSPQSSPVPSTKSQHKREPSSSSTKDFGSDRSDGNTSQKSSADNVTSPELVRSNSQEPLKDKKTGDRAKKKTPWYSALYPSYKYRSDEFKRLFKDLPPDERLIVEYSCAIQRDILVQGRLYVSQNHLSFYANIFRWETQVVLKWKEITSITKEKTARVIPNAIFVHTNNEKYFLTSFVSRDKAYVMLFRVWQNALMDKPMSTQEMWQWVHRCYGEELGLTSDDDDYIAPANTDEERNHNNNNNDKKDSIEAIEMQCIASENEKMSSDRIPNSSYPQQSLTCNEDDSGLPGDSAIPGQPLTDLSDSSLSESESEKNEGTANSIVKCPIQHEGRLMLHMQVSIHVDQLFTLLFTNSKFILDLHEIRKSTDVKQSEWTKNASTNQKGRTVSHTVHLAPTIGPKHAQVTESQIMLSCSSPGEIYAIEVEVNNSGVPYSDTFYITNHYCLIRGADRNTSSIAVYSQIKYRKSVWGFVRSYIEKHCWQGLEGYFSSLVKALEVECERTRQTMASGLSCTKRKGLRRRRTATLKPISSLHHNPVADLETKPLVQPIVLPTQTTLAQTHTTDTVAWIVFLTLFLLLILNAALYYKLWGLEQSERKWTDPISALNFNELRVAPKTPEEWRNLLQKQEQLHAFEIERWLRILKASVHLLQQVEKSLTGLQASIQGVIEDIPPDIDASTAGPLPVPNPDL